jgi:hypothetical protein
MAWVHRETDEPLRGDCLDFRPQSGKVKTMIDRHGCEPLSAGLFGEHRQTGLERKERESIVRVHFENAGGDVAQRGFRLHVDLTALYRAHAAEQPVDAVRIALVALSLSDDTRDCVRMPVRDSVAHQYLVRQIVEFGERQGDASLLVSHSDLPRNESRNSCRSPATYRDAPEKD